MNTWAKLALGVAAGYALNYIWEKAQLPGYGTVVFPINDRVAMGQDDLTELGIGVAAALLKDKPFGAGMVIGVGVTKVQDWLRATAPPPGGDGGGGGGTGPPNPIDAIRAWWLTRVPFTIELTPEEAGALGADAGWVYWSGNEGHSCLVYGELPEYQGFNFNWGDSLFLAAVRDKLGFLIGGTIPFMWGMPVTIPGWPPSAPKAPGQDYGDVGRPIYTWTVEEKLWFPIVAYILTLKPQYIYGQGCLGWSDFDLSQMSQITPGVYGAFPSIIRADLFSRVKA